MDIHAPVTRVTAAMDSAVRTLMSALTAPTTVVPTRNASTTKAVSTASATRDSLEMGDPAQTLTNATKPVHAQKTQLVQTHAVTSLASAMPDSQTTA